VNFYKYQALGNDYLVLNPAEVGWELTVEEIKLICHRHYGVGSDGILWGPMATNESDFALRIFNPDGSEAEKSGNGLRIFSRFLWDMDLVGESPFTIQTASGEVVSQVHPSGKMVSVEMGQVTFDSAKIPVTGPPRQVLNETITVACKDYRFCAASIGNPHCVLICDEVSEQEARSAGPLIENDPRFPNRTNVQFMKVLDRNNIQIEIWERGAGYTLASGSSSCAAAAVAHRLGLCDSKILVHMPGGILDITVGEGFELSMTGPVVKVAEGTIEEEIFR